MKKMYNIGEDIFIATAFVTFIIGGVLKLLGINELIWGITSRSVIGLSFMTLLFSMALSLYDMAHSK